MGRGLRRALGHIIGPRRTETAFGARDWAYLSVRRAPNALETRLGVATGDALTKDQSQPRAAMRVCINIKAIRACTIVEKYVFSYQSHQLEKGINISHTIHYLL